jgi:hypothetical protein
MGGHVDSSHVVLFQEINVVGQSCDMGLSKRGRFMVLVVEPRPVPSPKGSLHRKVEEAGVRACLETHTPITLWLVVLGWYFKKK